VTTPAHNVDYTYADYLVLEASGNTKHEFLAGQIYGMAGGTPEHAALAAALSGLLFAQLRGGRCRVHDSDLRVRVPATGLATYPDVTVVCGPREVHAEDENAVVNPSLLVEVLSPSTAAYDRGDKFEHYKRFASLRQYVLVSCSERCLEVWTRAADGSWLKSELRGGDVADLSSIGARLGVDELYDSAAEPSS
jgi:Uma2 family endonuclease